MKTICSFICEICHKPNDGILIYSQVVNHNCIFVRFKLNCCSKIYVKFFTKADDAKYIKEVSDGLEKKSA
jgi:hypothetical protein